MVARRIARSIAGCLIASIAMSASAEEPVDRSDAASEVLQSAQFYSSFDTTTAADYGQGDLRLWTRYGQPARGNIVEKLEIDEKRVRLVTGGVQGGAIELIEQLPDDGFLFYRAAGKLAPRDKGWGGTVSLWLKGNLADLNKHYCDPIMVVQNRYNNGAVWCDFTPEQPRDLRLGLFSKLPEGKTAPELPESQQPIVRAKAPSFSPDAWHHLALTWDHFDTGRADGTATLYLDGRPITSIKNQPADMHWQLDRVRMFLGSAFVGLLDEMATFDRPLTPAQVALLHSEPELLSKLKKKP